MARAMKATEANLIVQVHYKKLSGRELVSYGNPNRILSGVRKITQDNYTMTDTISLSALPQNLPEIVHKLLAPLYELFEFFPLSKRLVEQELASLQRLQFS